MTFLIKNGTIVNAYEKYKADLLIKSGKISAIGKSLDQKVDQVIDAHGKYIFPGGIDAHTHFAIPFMGTVSAGFDTTPAAAVGGTTTIIDFTPQPKDMSLIDALHKHREEQAEGKVAIDYSLHSMVQDAQQNIFSELPALIKAGVPTIKLFMAYKGMPFHSSDDVIFKMLQHSKEEGMLVMLHCENGGIIDILQNQLVSEGKTEPKYHADSRPLIVEAEAV